MGYETKMYIMQPSHSFFGDKPTTGQELAAVKLGRCGYNDTHTGRLIAKHTKKPTKDSKPPWALYARNPDRQQEAVECLREMAEVAHLSPSAEYSSENLLTLSNDIEDGTIVTDKYGAYLGVIEIDDMIAVMEEDQKVNPHCRFEWALVLMKSIKATFNGPLKIVTYGH